MIHDHTDGALDIIDYFDFNIGDDQASGFDDIIIDRNDIDININFFIIINNIIHSVIIISRLIIRNIKINIIRNINNTIYFIINFLQM